MSHTVNAIIHPYYGAYMSSAGYFVSPKLYPKSSEMIEMNTHFYNQVVQKVKNNPNELLFYLGDVIDPSKAHTNPAVQAELELQKSLKNLSAEVRARVAICSDPYSDAEHSMPTGMYEPTAFDTVGHQPMLDWLIQNGVHTFIDGNVKNAFLDITGLDEDAREEISFKDIRNQGNSSFLVADIPPEVGKLIRYIGTDNTNLDGQHKLRLKDSEDIAILASGEYINACVFIHSVSLAQFLGIPLQNISLNTEQPYLSVEGQAKKIESFRSPLELGQNSIARNFKER